MKNLIFLKGRRVVTALCTLISFSSFGQEEGMLFKTGTWTEVLAEAKKQNKPVFVDAFAVWCGPCKAMVKNVFPDPEVAGFYNTSFINYKLDMEKGEGIGFAKKYEVSGYPSYLYFNANGELIYKAMGFQAKDLFISEGKKAFEAEKQDWFLMKKKYEAGERSSDFLYKYIQILKENKLPSRDVAKEYLNSLDEKSLASAENMKFIFENTDQYDSREFRFILNNTEKFSEAFGKTEVITRIYLVARKEIRSAAEKKDETGFHQIIQQTEKAIPGEPKYVLNLKMLYFQNTSDWKNYSVVTAEYVEKYILSPLAAGSTKDPKKAQELNSIAWTYYEKVEDPAMLSKAVQWANISVEMDEQYYNLDTYGALLYKTGKAQDAALTLEKAIENARKTNTDFSETQQLLDKIRKAK